MENNDLNNEVNQNNKSKKIDSSILFICSFLSLEVLAFVVFGLSNNFIVYAFLGLVLLLGLLFASINELKKKDIISYAYLGFPLIIYSLFLIVSPFANSDFMSFGERVMVPFGLVSFSLCGYLFSYKKSIKLKNVFLAVYIALFLYTIIGFFYTMIQFEPFYGFTYSNAYIFYDGKPSVVPIGKIAYSLMGFKIQEVSLQYFSLYPALLATSCFALLFINPKKETKLFVLYAIFSLVGFLALIFMSNKFVLISLAALLFVLILLSLTFKNVIKISILSKIILVFEILFSVWFVFFFILSQSSLTFLDPLRNVLYNIPFFGKVFSLGRYRVILDGLFTKNKILGCFDVNNIASSESLLFDSFSYTGLLGGLAILFIMFFTIHLCLKYLNKNKNEKDGYKYLLVTFVFAYFACSFFNSDATPYVNYANVMLSTLNGPFLLVIFLLGFALYDTYSLKEKNNLNNDITIESNNEDLYEVMEESKNEEDK